MVVAKRLGGIEQDQINVASDSTMLERVVENERCCLTMLGQHASSGTDTIGVGFDGHTIVEQVGVDTLFIATIASEQDGWAGVHGQESFRDEANHGSFAGAACGEIADADGGSAQGVGFFEMPIVGPVAQSHGRRVGFGQRGEGGALPGFAAASHDVFDIALYLFHGWAVDAAGEGNTFIAARCWGRARVGRPVTVWEQWPCCR